jgi:hypothetical protein
MGDEGFLLTNAVHVSHMSEKPVSRGFARSIGQPVRARVREMQPSPRISPNRLWATLLNRSNNANHTRLFWIQKILEAADTVARRRKVNRSALIRRTLQEHLSRSRLMELEERDRSGFQSQPQRRRVSSVGEDCGLAGRLSRGDVHLCRFSAPDRVTNGCNRSVQPSDSRSAACEPPESIKSLKRPFTFTTKFDNLSLKTINFPVFKSAARFS